jgi:phosphotransferase system IIB component
MDPQQAANAAKQAIANSYKSKQAQWQRFLGEKAQNELESEMDKMINSEFGAAPQ